jgi:hypothetical protein
MYLEGNARCGHEWRPRDLGRDPEVCPKCKSPYWNKPRKADGPKMERIRIKVRRKA